MMTWMVGLMAASVLGSVYFEERFGDDALASRWTESDWKKSEGMAGEWQLSASEWYGDAVEDQGMQTKEDAKFYATSAKMDQVFNNKGKDLVVQFSVKFPQKMDCGGGYIKLLPKGTDQSSFSGDSDYALMFGPDICGTKTKKVHVIFSYKGKNLLTNKNIECKTDQLTHVYTLIVHSDNTYEVRIDGEEAASGNLLEDWDFLAPKEIKDPSVSKPADWADEAEIPDPDAKKPADWDKEPEMIEDTDASQPEDWDEELDGDWEAPMVPNPEFKGEWEPPMIPNPEYKGEWVHPMIPNPEYSEDPDVYVRGDMEFVGIELWQVKSGTLFDNIIVTDDIKKAEELMANTFTKNKDAEKEMFEVKDAEEKARKEEQRKATEELRRQQDLAKETDDEDDLLDDFDEEFKDEL